MSAVLVPSVAGKIGRIDALTATITRWRVVPGASARLVARSVVVAESIVLLTITSGVGLRFGALLAMALFGAVAVSAASVIARHISTTCGCFNAAGNERVNTTTVLRALLLVAITGLVAYWSDWSMGADPGWSVILIALVTPMCLAIVRRTVWPRCRAAVRAT